MSGVARSLPFDMSSYIAYDKLASMGQNWETSKDYGVSDAASTTDLSKASARTNPRSRVLGLTGVILHCSGACPSAGRGGWTTRGATCKIAGFPPTCVLQTQGGF